MKHLPAEIIHIILFYLRQDCCPLLLIRAACKEWKEIADHSPFWLEGKLIIVAPKIYQRLVLEGYHNGEPTQGVIQINEKVDAVPQMQFEIVVMQEYSPTNPLMQNLPNKYEEAAVICAKFLQKRRYYNKVWDSYIRWLPRCRFWSDISYKYFSSKYFIYACVLSAFVLSISVYFFSDIENYTHELSATQIAGFVGVYWNGGFFSFSLILHMVGISSQDYTFRYDDITPKFTLTGKDNVFLLMLSTLISVTLSFGLLQYALSHNDSNMKFVYISFPLWFFQIPLCYVVLRYVELNDQIPIWISLFTLCMIYLTITLAGLYYDSPSHNGILSLGDVFLPLILYGIGFFGLACAAIFDSLKLIYSYFKGEEIVYEPSISRITLRFFYNFMKSLSAILNFLLLFNLFYKGYMNSLSLSTSLMTIILFLVLIQVGIFSSKFDNRYLH